MTRTTTIALCGLFALGGSVSALAQQRVDWPNDVEGAIRTANQTKQPLMFWVVSRSGDREEDIEDEQKKAFRDPLVVQVAQRFSRAQLSRSRYSDLLEKWGLSSRTNLTVVFVTPEGEKIDVLAPGGVGNARAFAKKMTLVFRQYRTQLFNNELKPVLANEASSPRDLLTALQMIEGMIILEADDEVAKLLERENLPPKLEQRVYQVLAVLSEPAGTKALFEAALSDPVAAKALESAMPSAASVLAEYIGDEDLDRHILAYRMAGKICDVDDVRPDRFWQGPNERVKQEEAERVKAAAKEAAQRWKQTYGEYR